MIKLDAKFTVGIIVPNQFGVLNRVAGLYGKRGFNIESLAVGITNNPQYSRMTIVSYGDEDVQKQVVKQLQKLYDVKKIILYNPESTVSVEHLLVKLSIKNGDNTKASELINFYGGKVRDFGASFITAEVTGETSLIEEFIDKCKDFDILELCRSGAISMVLGTEKMLSIKELN